MTDIDGTDYAVGDTLPDGRDLIAIGDKAWALNKTTGVSEQIKAQPLTAEELALASGAAPAADAAATAAAPAGSAPALAPPRRRRPMPPRRAPPNRPLPRRAPRSRRPARARPSPKRRRGRGVDNEQGDPRVSTSWFHPRGADLIQPRHLAPIAR
ncbi:hypothetical protein FE772_24770 [Lysobacter enzymogenes]|nr:hypothetical protein [Lysobacter enzymogenes]QCW28385.1 hypothetical protein FE772_24770 [Lysobacter enzymogenes]